MPIDNENDPRAEAALREQAIAKLTQLRSSGYSSTYDAINDPEGKNSIALNEPDDILIPVIISNLKHENDINTRLAAEYPDSIEDMQIQPTPLPGWQMTSEEFMNWYITQRSSWVDRLNAKEKIDKWDKAKKLSELDKLDANFWRTVFGQSQLDSSHPLYKEIEEQNWLPKSRQAQELPENLYKQLLKQAAERDEEIPDAVFAAARGDFYENIQKQIRHGKVARQERSKVNHDIANRIVADLHEIDLNTQRNVSEIKRHFENLFPQIMVEQDKGFFLFKDKDTNLVYVSAVMNAAAERPWKDFFNFQKGTHYPINKVEKVAIVVKENPAIEQSDWVLIEKGQVAQ